jgi:hypothetical protein
MHDQGPQSESSGISHETARLLYWAVGLTVAVTIAILLGALAWMYVNGPPSTREARASAPLTRDTEIRGRSEFARKYESILLDQGYDAHVSATGPNGEVLRVECALASSVFAHRLQADAGFMQTLSTLGFARVDAVDSSGQAESISVP